VDPVDTPALVVDSGRLLSTVHPVETPALVVDPGRLRSNIERCQRRLEAAGLQNRPHVKTHRCTQIALLQLRAGAAGITCQKLSEAEVMADAGIENILVPYNLIGPFKLARLARLMERAQVAVSVDDVRLLDGLSSVADATGQRVAVLVECDVGYGRTGVGTPDAAARLAEAIENAGLKFAGLLGYPSPPTARAFFEEAVSDIAALGLACETRSLGGTTDLPQAAGLAPVVTEYRPGVYVFNDWNTVTAGAASPDQCALSIAATVVSVANSGRVVLDAGSKALSGELGTDGGYGHIVEAPHSTIARLSEEHGEVALEAGDRLELGQVVTVIPNHACVVVNLFDTLLLVEHGKVVDEWPIDARGKSL